VKILSNLPSYLNRPGQQNLAEENLKKNKEIEEELLAGQDARVDYGAMSQSAKRSVIEPSGLKVMDDQ